MGSGWQIKRIVLVGLQWACLTAIVGALVVRSDAALVDSIGGHLGFEWAALAGLVAGFLLGLSVPEPKALYPLALLMCIGASAFVMALVFAPAWAGVIERTSTLENFAITRGIFYTGLLLAPVGIGALVGQLLSGTLATHGEILQDTSVADQRGSWWDRPR